MRSNNGHEHFKCLPVDFLLSNIDLFSFVVHCLIGDLPGVSFVFTTISFFNNYCAQAPPITSSGLI